MSVSSAKAKLDPQSGDPVTGYVSRQDHKDSYDELVDDTALTGTTTAEALTVSGTLSAAALGGAMLSAATPLMDGTATAGTATVPARQDHVHPTDTMRVPIGAYRLKPRTGEYVSTKGNTGTGTFTMTLDQAVFTPILLDAGTCDRIGTEITTGAAGSAVRLGLYTNDTSTGLPSSLLLDAGTVDGSSTGVKEITISQTIAATDVYWLVAVAQGGTPAARHPGIVPKQWLASSAANAAGTPAASACLIARVQASVSAALPATAAASSAAAASAAPLVFARYA